MNHLLPHEAATFAGVSRVTILKWIDKHDIADGKDKFGRWMISAEKLSDVVTARKILKLRQPIGN